MSKILKWASKIQINSKLVQKLFWTVGHVSTHPKILKNILFAKIGFLEFKLCQILSNKLI